MTCHFLAWHLALLGMEKDWSAQNQDNVTEWGIQGYGVAQAVEHSAVKVWAPAWRIDPAWRKYFQFGLFNHSNQLSTTGPSKAMVCAVLSVGKSSLCRDRGFPLNK